MLNERGDTIEYDAGSHHYSFVAAERPNFKWEPRGTFIHFPGSRLGTALEYVMIEGATITIQYPHVRNERYKTLSVRLKGFKTDGYQCKASVKFGDEPVDSVELNPYSDDPWVVSAPSYGQLLEIQQYTGAQQAFVHMLNRNEPVNVIINPSATASVYLDADGDSQQFTVRDFEHVIRGSSHTLQRYSVIQIPNEREHHVNQGKIDALMQGDRKLCTFYCGDTDI